MTKVAENTIDIAAKFYFARESASSGFLIITF